MKCSLTCALWLHSIGKPSNDSGVDVVCFDQLSGGSGEVWNLTSVDHADVVASMMQYVDKSSFEFSGRFQANILWVVFLQKLQ